MGVVIYRRVINVFEIPRDILAECIGRGLDIKRDDPVFPVLLEVSLGEGMTYDRASACAVNYGDGLTIGPDGKLTTNPGGGIGHGNGQIAVNAGSGLTIDAENDLAIDVGAGLVVDENNALGVKTGPGMVIDGNNELGIKIGLGLEFTPESLEEDILAGPPGSLSVLLGPTLYVNDANQIAQEIGVGLSIIDNKLVVDAAVLVDRTPDPSKQTVIKVQIDSLLSLNAMQLSLTKTYQEFTITRNGEGQILDVVAGDITEQVDDVLLHSGYGYGYGAGIAPKRESTPTFPNFYQK